MENHSLNIVFQHLPHLKGIPQTFALPRIRTASNGDQLPFWIHQFQSEINQRWAREVLSVDCLVTPGAEDFGLVVDAAQRRGNGGKYSWCLKGCGVRQNSVDFHCTKTLWTKTQHP